VEQTLQGAGLVTARGDTTEAQATPTWSRWSEIPAVIRHRQHLTRTLSAALVVGALLFCINQLDVVLAGEATTRTWIKTGTTFLVPFLVANYGVLTATRRSSGDDPGDQG
jgi:hypothetical protein